jgi:hypothetical protein
MQSINFEHRMVTSTGRSQLRYTKALGLIVTTSLHASDSTRQGKL